MPVQTLSPLISQYLPTTGYSQQKSNVNVRFKYDLWAASDCFQSIDLFKKHTFFLQDYFIRTYLLLEVKLKSSIYQNKIQNSLRSLSVFSRKEFISGFKVMSFLVLSTAHTLNTGCQNTSQKTQPLQKETMRAASTDVNSQEADTPKSDLQKQPGKTQLILYDSGHDG